MVAATAGAGQFVLRQFVDDFYTREVSRQWLALATARSYVSFVERWARSPKRAECASAHCLGGRQRQSRSAALVC